MNVELRATMEVLSEFGFDTVWCDEAEATAFSVYLGEPGDFEWCADFRGYGDARNWAEEVAECHDCELIDYVEKEHEHQST
jgi:hypothetical protein